MAKFPTEKIPQGRFAMLMIQVKAFTFNPFQENTYLAYDDTKDCIIIDPGCYHEHERQELRQFIEKQQLKPVRLLNTHCHIDHVFGNQFIVDTYGLGLEIHRGELPVLQTVDQIAALYQIPMPDTLPEPSRFIEPGEIIAFGNTTLKTLFTPGHSPASISFFAEADRVLFAGDVLFQRSIGRTDLPGGDMNTLLNSIRQEFFPLGDDVVVYPGHGDATTIGEERRSNPYL